MSLRSCLLSHESLALPWLPEAPMGMNSLLPIFASCEVFSAPLGVPPWMHYGSMLET